MPFYAYRHDSCGWNAVLCRSMEYRVLDACPQCGDARELRPLITKEHSPNVMLPAVTNQLYNNGMGKYDSGLGKWLSSRQEHSAEMERQGVTEYSGSYEDYMDAQNREPAPVSIETIKDYYEEATARVNNGERPTDYGNPNPDLTPVVLTPEE